MATKAFLSANPLKELARFNQSPWYDNIERSLIKNGGLKELIDDFGILGVTTNPSIFEKAIVNSSAYDGQISELAGNGKSILEIYDELTISDVREAADLFREIYLDSDRMDGYISIEVLPDFAHDVIKTVDYAREIFKRINRENIMIKIPATSESPQAITTLISEGININATLIFSKAHYETIAKAYIDGLKLALKNKRDISKICSVASVFVSRVDTKVDLLLGELSKSDSSKADLAKSLKGRVAVANCKIIYQVFKKIFAEADFEKLKNKGAKAQRVLWGSTSTKNPLYSDVKYVEELIGADTINTIPPETVKAFREHGRPGLSLEKELNEAERILAELKVLGINLDSVCQEIQDAGVKAFQDSFNKLIAAIKEKV